MKEDKILQKLEEQGKKLDELGETVKTMVEHNQFVDEQLEFIRDNMVIRSEYLQDQDHIMTFLKRLDEDRLFTHGRLDRVEKHLGLRTA